MTQRGIWSGPAKFQAHGMVTQALRLGALTRPRRCQLCAERVTMAHHDDYARPLDVRWLCKRHHVEWHAEHGPGINSHLDRKPPQRRALVESAARVERSLRAVDESDFVRALLATAPPSAFPPYDSDVMAKTSQNKQSKQNRDSAVIAESSQKRE